MPRPRAERTAALCGAGIEVHALADEQPGTEPLQEDRQRGEPDQRRIQRIAEPAGIGCGLRGRTDTAAPTQIGRSLAATRTRSRQTRERTNSQVQYRRL